MIITSVDVQDTTAAGDCFVAVLARLAAQGGDAALTCSRKGSQSSIPERRITDSVENRCN
ncbi:hypothetical protein FY150_19285 [Agrobacterium tumefaciens]|nr:hypothetical protein FY150_19285 [Agrobacterium tumefaciens]